MVASWPGMSSGSDTPGAATPRPWVQGKTHSLQSHVSGRIEKLESEGLIAEPNPLAAFARAQEIYLQITRRGAILATNLLSRTFIKSKVKSSQRW